MYLSLYFKQRRGEYYDTLQKVRAEGDWEGWLAFYLQGVQEVAQEAAETAKRLCDMFEDHRRKVQTLGKAATSALRVHDLLKERGILSLSAAASLLGLSFPTVTKAMVNLEDLGLVREFTGKRKNRLFSYDPYIKVLSEGTQ